MPRLSANPSIRLAAAFCGMLGWSILASPAVAQAPAPAPTATAVTTPSAAAATAPVVLGQPLTLNLGTKAAGADCGATVSNLNSQNLVLVANGQTITGARAIFECSAQGEVLGTATTSIAGNDDEAAQRRQAWQAAFDGFFSLAGRKTVQVAFGPATGGMTTPARPVTIQGASTQDLTLAIVWAALIVALFVWAFLKRFGRDPVPEPLAGVPIPANYVQPYSLSRFQLLWWSGIVTAAYAGIVTITGSMDTISTGTMALMGIVGGTSLLAVMQDNRPSGDDDRRKAHQARYIAAAANPTDPQNAAIMAESIREIYPQSQGPLCDLVSDAHGYNIHRFQLLAWTIVLGFTFAYEVTRTLGMPELSANLLALTGISNGTYFGFKIQEQQVANPTT